MKKMFSTLAVICTLYLLMNIRIGTTEAGVIPSPPQTMTAENDYRQDHSGKKAEPLTINGDDYRYNWIPVGSYDRFSLFVDEPYLLNNEAAIIDFFNKFVPRFDLLESLTGWGSEKFFGTKLEIYLEASSGCYGGRGDPGDMELYFSDPLYMTGCTAWGETEELGNTWPFMSVALHEATHSICPTPIYDRVWLSEAWACYNELNILVQYGDMTQGTADGKIHAGNSYFNWDGYVANDYHDTSPNQNEIQSSNGYDIAAWMFTMLRNDYALDWNVFYSILNNNIETLNMSWQLGGAGSWSYYTDTYIVYVFGLTLGMTFPGIQAIFRYDGPDGPGWGVRQWENLDWLADASPGLSFSDNSPDADQVVEIIATILNYNVILEDVSVRFYDGVTMIDQLTVNLSVGAPTVVSTYFSRPAGTYDIRVIVDEDNIKIESDDTNNEDTDQITFNPPCGDSNGAPGINILDIVYLINYLYKSGPDPICSPMFSCADVNSDRSINILDIVYLINYIYKNGPEPDCP